MARKATTAGRRRTTAAQPSGQQWSRAEFLRFLRTTYDEETKDHYHLIQRCGFILTAIVLLGTIASNLANGGWIKTYLPRADVVLYLGAIVLVFAALIVAGVFLVMALVPRDWESVPSEAEELCKFAGIETGDEPRLTDDHDTRLSDSVYAQLATELARATDTNRSRNFKRYTWLQRAFVAIVVAIVLIFVQLLMHVIVYLSNPIG